MRNILFSLLIITILGCEDTIQKKIFNSISQQCKTSNTCTIKISDITDFEWEKMYIFKESASLEEINIALGFSYDYFGGDIARRIVFTKSNTVVYHEDDFPNPEESPNHKVFFNIGDSVHYKVFSYDKAIFEVKRNEMENAVYYELTPLNKE